MEASMTHVKGEQAEREAKLALLLGKGQALLNLQQADTALACFDEVIALDSTNPEAFVKKGMALERLGKLDEAIDCYDRAIALDDSMTMAYLSKGGVFNRLERYGEALQCYEQALRAQQKPGVA
jgi:tetratricopeptide (TPR) repeat protein